ncbi:MAG: glycosyltransferase [Alphaproteobacteria bacterium]|nr:glycosyltransferase [Alphaproteobacteria bacterium]
MPLRRLLRPIRRAALDASLSGLSPVTAPSTGRPMVVGFLSAPMGIGAGGARLHAGLSALGFAPSSFDLTPIYQKDRAILPWPPEGEKKDDGRGPVLVHVNAPESPHALSAVGKARLKGRFLAGYWAWELPLIPPAWIEAAKRYHEIWVPSDFTANSLRPALGDKVKVVGYPLDPPAIDAEAVAAIRQRYLPDPDAGFLALAAGDARSSMSRKNPGAAIRAFRSAFPDRDDVRLLVKTSGLASASAAVRHRLDVAIGGDRRIILHDEPLPQAEFDALFAAADVFISLHRSEGFGLSIAASLLAGTPVVVTGWSGNMDFAALTGTHAVGFTLVTPQADQAQYNLAGAVWADPDEGEAAAILARIARPSDKERLAIARAAKACFAPSAWRQRLTPAFLAACERN